MPQPLAKPFSGIFISYRRDDASGHAGRLFDRLNAHFGDEQIFMDIDQIQPGEDFVQIIENAVGSCEILIAIIGRHWLSSAGETSRRLDNPNDFVRLEIAAALKREIGVIPVLVHGASMPKPLDLPDDLSKLSRRNALDLSDLRWQRDVNQLISALEKILKHREEARNRKALDEEERQLAADAQRQAAEMRRLKQEAEEDERRNAEEENAQARKQEAARRRAEAEARLAEAQARIQADLDASDRAEEEAQRLDEAFRLRAEEESRRRSEAEARLKEEETRLQNAQEARAIAEEEAQRLAEEFRLRAEEESRRRAEVEARLREEEARLLTKEEERLINEMEAHEKAAAEEGEPPNLSGEARYISQLESLMSAARERQRQEEAHLMSAARIRQLLEEAQARLLSEEDLSESLGQTFQAEEVASAYGNGEPAKGIDVAFAEKGIVSAEEDAGIPSEILKRLSSPEASQREAALAEVVRVGGDDAFRCISRAFDDQSADVRNAAAQALFDLQSDRAATFTRALREGAPERRRHIGQALAASGLAKDAIGNLTGESREKTYDAFSLLYLMAKAGEIQPLMQAIEDSPHIEVRIAVVKLLALSGRPEIIPAFRRFAVRGSLPTEVRSAIMEAIYQIGSQARESSPSLGAD